MPPRSREASQKHPFLLQRAAVTPHVFFSFATVAFHDVICNASLRNQKLILTWSGAYYEDSMLHFFFEEEVIADSIGSDDASCVGCCLISNDRLLVLASADDALSFAATLSFPAGRPASGSIAVKKLAIVGAQAKGVTSPFLCEYSPNNVLLSSMTSSLWLLHIKGSELTVDPAPFATPEKYGFCALPVLLGAGQMLVAGSYPSSTDIYKIAPDSSPHLQKVGEIPGEKRSFASLFVLAKRFLIGFGGSSKKDGSKPISDLWVFDSRSGASSLFAFDESRGQEINFPSSCLVPLLNFKIDGAATSLLVFAGGRSSNEILTVSLRYIQRFVLDSSVKGSFMGAVGLLSVAGPRMPQSGSGKGKDASQNQKPGQKAGARPGQKPAPNPALKPGPRPDQQPTPRQDSSSNAQVARLQQQLREKESELAALRERLSALGDGQEDLASLREKLRERDADLARLKRKNSEWLLKYDELAEKYSLLKKRYRERSEVLRQLRSAGSGDSGD